MPKGKYLRTKYHNNINRQGHLGKKLSDETKRKMSLSQRGKKLSKEHKKKLSISKMGNKNPMKNPETVRKVVLALKGRKNPKHSAFMKGRPSPKKGQKGMQVAWNKGIFGEDSHSWQGGKSFEPYSPDWMETLRESIRQRDGYTCQECGIHQEELNSYHKKLDIHHIDYDKKNCNPINLITLCKICHSKTNYNREYWKKYFLEQSKM